MNRGDVHRAGGGSRAPPRAIAARATGATRDAKLIRPAIAVTRRSIAAIDVRFARETVRVVRVGAVSREGARRGVRASTRGTLEMKWREVVEARVR
jgi:hypothetical protein